MKVLPGPLKPLLGKQNIQAEEVYLCLKCLKWALRMSLFLILSRWKKGQATDLGYGRPGKVT